MWPLLVRFGMRAFRRSLGRRSLGEGGSAPCAVESALDQQAVLAEFGGVFRLSSRSASLKIHFDHPHSFRSSLSAVSIDAAGNPL